MSQQSLIERAIKRAGNGRALAAQLQRHESQISHWKRGREQIPDEAIAELAIYLGEDPIQVLAAERGGAWTRVAQALRDKVSAGFDWLRLIAKPRRCLILAR